MLQRAVKRVHAAHRDDVHDLITRRPVPNPALDQVDPFLFLNHHGPQVYPPGNQGLPFGPHPHRGFETVTFILEGELTHRDSAGHESAIHAGGVQWMTAGRGLVHSELSSREFQARGGPLEILQLWVNLPARLKMTEPRYIGLQQGDLAAAQLDAGRVTLQITSGTFAGTVGPVQSLTGVELASAHLAPSGAMLFSVSAERNVLFYVVRGTVVVQGQRIAPYSLVEFGNAGSVIDVRSEEGAILLFGHAHPYGEPVVSQGPFVMNTRAEIQQAIADFHAGKFGPA